MNERPYIVAATILSERKSWDYNAIAENRSRLRQVNEVYLNLELMEPRSPIASNRGMESDFEKPVQCDTWSLHSTWRPEVRYDQDQRRLLGIVTARNMAIDYALCVGATHLLFIDSDVFPDPNGLQYLLDLNVPLCGGYVPGRGEHGHVHYVNGSKRGIWNRSEHVIECDWGTCGYMLIRREVFGRIRFRWGDDPDDPMNFLSEDPAFCLDWARFSRQGFLIDKRATAEHRGELKAEEAAVDSWEALHVQR